MPSTPIPALIGPRQVVLVTCRGSVQKQFSAEREERDNITPVNWHMPCSAGRYAIALHTRSFSAQLIRQSGSFVVNFIPETMKAIAEACGAVSGAAADKFGRFSIAAEAAEKIDAPRLRGALGFLECSVVQQVPCDDYLLFIGTILHKKLRDGSARRLIL